MNINYQDSSNYPNLAQLWLTAATAENQDTNTKINLFETTSELSDRIKNIDESIPHEEVSYICDKILAQFNQLTPENQKNIAKFIGTLNETGYEHLHELFQTIGDSQSLPNYFASQPDPSNDFLHTTVTKALEIFSTFTKIKQPPPEGIINLGIEARKCVDLSKESPIDFHSLEEGIQDQILSYLDYPSHQLFNNASKIGIAKFLNQDHTNLFKIESPEELIKFFGVSGVFVKKLPTFKERLSVESLTKMTKAFPNLQVLSIPRIDNSGAAILKDFKSLRNLTIHYSPQLTDEHFLEKFSSLRNLSLEYTGLEHLDVQSLANLISLKIEGCSKLTTVNHIKNLTSLSDLTLTSCKEININFLEVPSLTEVTLEFCSPKKETLSSLGNHPNISKLVISDEDLKMENFDFLLTMPALKSFVYGFLTLPEGLEDKLQEKGIEVKNLGRYRLI